VIERERARCPTGVKRSTFVGRFHGNGRTMRERETDGAKGRWRDVGQESVPRESKVLYTHGTRERERERGREAEREEGKRCGEEAEQRRWKKWDGRGGAGDKRRRKRETRRKRATVRREGETRGGIPEDGRRVVSTITNTAP